MELGSDNKIFEDISAHTSHAAEYSTDCLSVKSSSPHRALLQYNPRNAGTTRNNFMENDTENDIRRRVKHIRANPSEYSYKTSRKLYIDTPNIRKDNETLSNNEYLSHQYPQTQFSNGQSSGYRGVSKKVSVFTKSDNISNKSDYLRANVEETCIDNYDNCPVIIDRRKAEKTTYCRPMWDINTSEFMYRTTARNNKLQGLVKKIVEAREKEKESEAWNNYINELKNKHRYQYEGVRKRHIEDHVNSEMISNYYVGRLGIDQPGYTSLFRDSEEACSIREPSCSNSRPRSIETRYINYSPYENVQCSYPISSQARFNMLQKARVSSPRGRLSSEGYQCEHGTRSNMIFADVQPGKKKSKVNKYKRFQNERLFRNVSVQTSMPKLKEDGSTNNFEDSTTKINTNEMKSDPREHNKSKHADNEGIDNKYPYRRSDDKGNKNETNTNQIKRDSKEDHKRKTTSIEGLDNKYSYRRSADNTITKLTQSKGVQGDTNQQKDEATQDDTKNRQRDNSTQDDRREKDETTKERYQKVSDNVARLNEHIENSTDTSKQSSLDNIENKLDILIRTINSLLEDMKVEDTPAPLLPSPRGCTMSTCIARKNRISVDDDYDSKNETSSLNTVREPSDEDGNKTNVTTNRNTSAGNLNNNKNSKSISPNKANTSENALKNVSPGKSNGSDNDDRQINSENDNATSNHVIRHSSSGSINCKSEISMTNITTKEDNKKIPKEDDPETKDENKRYNVDHFVCLVTDRSSSAYHLAADKRKRYIFVDRGVSKIDEILIEELDKSKRAKRDINDILERELYRPCGVQMSFDVPTRDRATEVTASLSKAKITDKEMSMSPLKQTAVTIAAVNTDPVSLLGLLRISKDTIRQLLSFMYFDYLSMLPRPAVSANCGDATPYVCNICGAAFRRSTELCDHIEGHDLGKGRDCCVCSHILDIDRRRLRIFSCPYCGQCFIRAYCCELHQQSCARRLGRRHDVSENLAYLR